MKLEYRGKNADEKRSSREAYICYDSKKEQKIADALFEVLQNKGWKIYAEEECMSIPVYDKNEYLQFAKDYKIAKKEAREKQHV